MAGVQTAQLYVPGLELLKVELLKLKNSSHFTAWSMFDPFGDGSEVSVWVWAAAHQKLAWGPLQAVGTSSQTVLNLTQCLCHEANDVPFLSLIKGMELPGSTHTYTLILVA